MVEVLQALQMELLTVYALVVEMLQALHLELLMVLALMVEKLWALHMGLQMPQTVVFVNLAEMSHHS